MGELRWTCPDKSPGYQEPLAKSMGPTLLTITLPVYIGLTSPTVIILKRKAPSLPAQTQEPKQRHGKLPKDLSRNLVLGHLCRPENMELTMHHRPTISPILEQL